MRPISEPNIITLLTLLYYQKLTNITLNLNINKIKQEARSLLDQTIENIKSNYSDSCRIYVRPSGTEPVIRVLVEAENRMEVDSLSREITNKLSFEINKILNLIMN